MDAPDDAASCAQISLAEGKPTSRINTNVHVTPNKKATMMICITSRLLAAQSGGRMFHKS
jgi:hypothetical protein